MKRQDLCGFYVPYVLCGSKATQHVPANKENMPLHRFVPLSQVLYNLSYLSQV